MEDSFYRQIIQESLIAYAYHQIICNKSGIPYDYEFIEVNAPFEKLTGLIRSDIIGRRVTEIIPGIIWPEFNWVELCRNIEINEDKKEFEQFSKPLNRWYRISVYSPEKDYLITRFIDISTEKGKLDEFKSLEEENEISEYQRMESELTKIKGVAEDANKAKSQFLANMSHEIRTPLNGILGMSQLLVMNLKGENRKMAEIIISSGKALLAIINDILDLSKIEAGKVRLSQEQFDINILMNEVNKVLKILAKKKGLSYRCNIDSTIANNLVGDPDRLRQVLFNLIGNAIKFTEHGGINLSIVKGKVFDGKIQLNFSINDSGIGISKDKIGQLFTCFTQGDDSVTKKYKGIGLGLVISKKLINMMGGEISVESKVGVGSNFVFSSIFESKVYTGELPKIGDVDVSLKVPVKATALLVEDDYLGKHIDAEKFYTVVTNNILKKERKY